MRQSLLYKYFLLSATLILIGFIILGGGLSLQVYKYSVGEKEHNLEQVAVRVSNLTTDVMTQFSSIRQQTFQLLLSTMMDNGNLHAILCGLDGRVLVTSDSGDNAQNVYVQSNIVKKIRRKSL